MQPCQSAKQHQISSAQSFPTQITDSDLVANNLEFRNQWNTHLRQEVELAIVEIQWYN